MESPKLAILMWYNDYLKNKYADISYDINKMYCDKHDITLIKEDFVRCKDKTAHWEKVAMCLFYLEKFDYVMWIDADAHFFIDKNSILNLIDQYKNYDIIFSGDIGKSLDIKKDNINTGVFICKNTLKTKKILETWLYEEELYNLQLVNWDQGVLREMYSKNILDIQKVSYVVPYGILQHFEPQCENFKDKPYINHLAGEFKWKYNKIIPVFTEYLNKIKIN